VFDALASWHTEIIRAARLSVPPAWTADSFAWKQQREERRYQIDQQQKMHASLDAAAKAARATIEQMQQTAAQELADGMAEDRRRLFAELSQRALEQARQDLDLHATSLRSLWIAHLRRALRSDRALSHAMNGDSSGDDNWNSKETP
jgi:hypothetical protein